MICIFLLTFYKPAGFILLTNSPSEGELILEEVISVEQSECLHEVSHENREGVLEQEVWTFFEWDT